jgi:drug/metabolite transporter (DMT)-like permease
MVPMQTTRRNVFLAFASLYIIWGSTYLAIKFAIETMPPLLMASARFFVSGAFLYGWAFFKYRSRPTADHWRSAGIVGTLLLLGGNGGVAWAELTVPSGIAAILIALVPIWMVLLNWAIRGQRPGWRVTAGLVIGFAGVWYLLKPGTVSFHWPGIAILLLASLLWALGSVLSKSLRFPASALQSVGMQMLCGATALLAASVLAGEWTRFDVHGVSAHSLLALLYLVVCGSLFGFTAYIWLLKVSTVARVSTYAYVNPVVAVFLGVVFAKESLGASTLIAGAIILAGVILIQTSLQETEDRVIN